MNNFKLNEKELITDEEVLFDYLPQKDLELIDTFFYSDIQKEIIKANENNYTLVLLPHKSFSGGNNCMLYKVYKLKDTAGLTNLNKIDLDKYERMLGDLGNDINSKTESILHLNSLIINDIIVINPNEEGFDIYEIQTSGHPKTRLDHIPGEIKDTLEMFD